MQETARRFDAKAYATLPLNADEAPRGVTSRFDIGAPTMRTQRRNTIIQLDTCG